MDSPDELQLQGVHGNIEYQIHAIKSNLETTLGAGTVSWRYVPTGDNPADDTNRGLHPVELNMNHRYSAGPGFLYKAAVFWPENKVEVLLEEDKRERKKLRWVGVSQESEPVLGWKRYSSLAKLRRGSPYAMRFVNNTRVEKELGQTDRWQQQS